MGSLAGSFGVWDGRTRTSTDGMVRKYAISQDPPPFLPWRSGFTKTRAAAAEVRLFLAGKEGGRYNPFCFAGTPGLP